MGIPIFGTRHFGISTFANSVCKKTREVSGSLASGLILRHGPLAFLAESKNFCYANSMAWFDIFDKIVWNKFLGVLFGINGIFWYFLLIFLCCKHPIFLLLYIYFVILFPFFNLERYECSCGQSFSFQKDFQSHLNHFGIISISLYIFI